ncbi:MAG: twin transmembrane helix small protein [Chakrabartia sp.]
MNTFLIILLIVAVIATVVTLVRGVIAFLQTTEADLKGEGGGPSVSGVKQNKMMMNRVLFQALAIAIVAILLMFNRG